MDVPLYVGQFDRTAVERQAVRSPDNRPRDERGGIRRERQACHGRRSVRDGLSADRFRHGVHPAGGDPPRRRGIHDARDRQPDVRIYRLPDLRRFQRHVQGGQHRLQDDRSARQRSTLLLRHHARETVQDHRRYRYRHRQRLRRRLARLIRHPVGIQGHEGNGTIPAGKQKGCERRRYKLACTDQGRRRRRDVRHLSGSGQNLYLKGRVARIYGRRRLHRRLRVVQIGMVYSDRSRSRLLWL